MKRALQLIIFTLTIITAFHKCANPGRPTGGPKDTIPPTLLYSSPVSGTTNFNSQVIELEFSEYINADKLKQELIITPKSNIKYKSIVKRNKLIIKLDGKLLDSTTYNFNFANGVTDITEKTPAVNLSLAFSTGPFIDSLSVKGSVEELLTKEAGKGYVVSLYPYTDTLDYFANSPMYFTTANDSGNYKLNFIKKGKYKIISFNDDNGNFLLDPESESHGFISDIIDLDSATQLPIMRCILQNIKPLALINARPTGRYVEVKFNKQIDNYTIQPNLNNHNIIGEKNDIIRLYKPEQINYEDSVTSYISANDSLGNVVTDTIKYVFLESNRKPAGFSFSTQDKLTIKDNPSITLNFNKPISSSSTDSIQIKADSIFTYWPEKEINWNNNRTSATIEFSLNTDSLLHAFEKALPKDSTSIDSTLRKGSAQKRRNLELIINKGSFISIENDTSKLKSIQLEEQKTPPTGTLKLDLQTEEESFILQLLNKSGKVAYQKRNEKKISFTTIRPDTYDIRILIDTNGDGKWSYGNLLKNDLPEEVYIYSEEISVRENWVVELSITF